MQRVVGQKKNPMPLILGGVGGGILLIVLIAVAMSGGGSTERRETPSPTATPWKPPAPDVSNLEAEGKSKCEQGAGVCNSKAPLLRGTAPEGKEKLRAELESAIKTLNEGLAAYKRAAEIAGKRYATDGYERARDGAVARWADDVESEAQKSLDEGLKIFQGTQSMMTGGSLSADQKAKLAAELEKAKKLFEHGFNLYERSEGLTGHRFETVAYGRAYKALKMKLPELK